MCKGSYIFLIMQEKPNKKDKMHVFLMIMQQKIRKKLLYSIFYGIRPPLFSFHSVSASHGSVLISAAMALRLSHCHRVIFLLSV